MRTKVVSLLVVVALVLLASISAFAATEKYTGTVIVAGTTVQIDVNGKKWNVTPNDEQKKLLTMNGKKISVEGTITGENLTISKIEPMVTMGMTGPTAETTNPHAMGTNPHTTQ